MCTIQQRCEILRHYFENHGNVGECVRKLRTDFGRRETPSAQYVRYLVTKLKETAIFTNKQKSEKPKTLHTPENIAAVAESVRFRFAKLACDRLTEDADFGKKSSSFQMKLIVIGYVNNQNCRIWAQKTQRVTV